jgi:hypothetical protein
MAGKSPSHEESGKACPQNRDLPPSSADPAAQGKLLRIFVQLLSYGIVHIRQRTRDCRGAAPFLLQIDTELRDHS